MLLPAYLHTRLQLLPSLLLCNEVSVLLLPPVNAQLVRAATLGMRCTSIQVNVQPKLQR